MKKLLIIFLLALALVACKGSDGTTTTDATDTTATDSTGDTGDTTTDTGGGTDEGTGAAIAAAPTNLVMPFDTADLRLDGGLISPFGLIRQVADGNIGHGGIDIPLNLGSPIYAAAAGLIIKSEAATDSRPGYNLTLLIDQTSGTVGWAFLYEHINLATGIGLGSQVTSGLQLGTGYGASLGGHHMQLTYQNSSGYWQDHTCWVTQLESTVQSSFTAEFEANIRTDANFISAWTTVTDADGKFPYKALLDTTLYPNGARLCYPLGLDVR